MSQQILKAFLYNDLEVIKSITMMIAHEVRNNIEDFHVEHLSDEEMKELNPLIREGIYNALFAIINYDRDTSSRDFVEWHLRSIPEYWESPQLHPKFIEAVSRLSNHNTIRFQSKFLTDQYDIGNIIAIPKTRYLRLLSSFEFIGVEAGKHNHKNKILSHLRKEGYMFSPCVDAYSKNDV